MRALLDTHAFLWAIAEQQKLPVRVRQIYTGPNDLWLSVASIWEATIKSQAGRLALPQPAGAYLVKELVKNNIEVLPIKVDHVLRNELLPTHHRDPFDRILIAQSLEEDLPIITSDAMFRRYDVEVIW
jgi:PIN domain nuclease of toxin-antitoxin system